MFTLAGVLTAALLLVIAIAAPALGATLVSVTVQLAEPPLETDPGVQLREASCAWVVTVIAADLEEPL
jgi:hypothetical protein